MRVTIVVNDNMVLVDGAVEEVDCSALAAENKHAVQWYGSKGEVEFMTDPETGDREPNEKITDFAPYQEYVAQWHSKHAATKPGPEPQGERRGGT